jgi:hypothetical protein
VPERLSGRGSGPARRVAMPAADELFRPTVVAGDADAAEAPERAPLTPSGRVRHDEKMTIYVTADELIELEHARLTLRRSGLSVDRGRLVREAIALALADLDENGDDSEIVRRLRRG